MNINKGFKGNGGSCFIIFDKLAREWRNNHPGSWTSLEDRIERVKYPPSWSNYEIRP